jgi:hypothetical protein
MGFIDETICIACGLEDESAFHLLCLGVEEYAGATASVLLRLALASGRFTVTP